ncbi:MAG: methionine synthase [Nitrospirota bacterium]
MIRPFATTGIGSFPHEDPDEACRLVLSSCDIPFWPQLPSRSFREFMVPQFSEGMPFLRIDDKRENVWIEKDDSDSLMRFYETCTDDLKSPVSEEFARGLYVFLKLIRGRRYPVLKGQVTGPLTFTLGVKDTSGKFVYFDEELREVALLLLKAKIRWQAELLRQSADQTILFLDEPILSALGSSAYLGVSTEEVLRLLKEVSDAILDAGAIPGIHCCSKADWPLVIQSGVRIISFDAYDYLASVSLFPGEFTEFLKNGGYLAWGIVPTTESIKTETTLSLKERFDEGMHLLSRHIPAELLLSRILLTPSCGTASQSIQEADRVFRVLQELQQLLREPS